MVKADWKNISRRPLLVFGFTVLTPMIFAAPTQAADYDAGSIHITAPWARATPKGASSGAAYMTITNNGNTPDRVSCVSSDASAKCQIHTMTTENGVMKMRPVEGGLEIKPGETVMLKPSGVHVKAPGAYAIVTYTDIPDPAGYKANVVDKGPAIIEKLGGQLRAS